MSDHSHVYKVGDEVVVVRTLHPLSEPIVRDGAVATVGKRWVTLRDGTRFDKQDWTIDGKGYSSPGMVFPSVAAYEAHEAARDAISNLMRVLHQTCSYMIRPSATADEINAVAQAVLGLRVVRKKKS